MKSIYRIYVAAVAAVSCVLFTACELDNYDGPDAQIYGEIRDIETDALIEQDIVSGSRICYEELGYENPEQQYMNFMVNGEYRNNLVFSGKYDIYFAISNFNCPLGNYTLENMTVTFVDSQGNKISYFVLPKEISLTAATKEFDGTDAADPSVTTFTYFGPAHNDVAHGRL